MHVQVREALIKDCLQWEETGVRNTLGGKMARVGGFWMWGYR